MRNAISPEKEKAEISPAPHEKAEGEAAQLLLADSRTVPPSQNPVESNPAAEGTQDAAGGKSVAEARQGDKEKGGPGGQSTAKRADGRDKDATGQACPVSREYNALIEKSWRNIYDPTPLGDLAALKNKYNCQIKSPADAFRFVNQELGKIEDPYSRVLNPAQVKQQDRLMKGASKGIGIEVVAVDPELAKQTGSLKVIEVIPGSSAAKKGVQKGDYISNVDGVDLTGKSSAEAFDLIQSEKTHNITVFRKGEKKELTLEQTTVDVPAVVDRVIPGTNIAYIRIRDFMQDDESYELQNAIKRHPNVDGFVFDVRGNLGGSVRQALESASMVVGGGTLLTTRMRHEDDNPAGPARYDKTDYTLDRYELVTRTTMPDGKVEEQRDLRLADLVNKPSVVLVNGDTASAAEIFAGALQQNGEATLVGTQTYGKGIGQTVFFDQPAGSRLQVTNFRFFTPNGEWIGDAGKNRKGIRPDKEVANGTYSEPESPNDLQFQAAIAEINKKLGR